jgi:hypothetical protein
VATGVTITKVGYRLNLTLGANTVPSSTQVTDYISEASNIVEELEPEATQNAKDAIIMKLVLQACEYEMRWQHAQGADSAGDEHTGSFAHRATYMTDWITKKDIDFLKTSAARNTSATIAYVGSFRRA